MKETFKLIFQIIFFFLVSVPLAVLLLLTANIYFEIKRLIKWLGNTKHTH